MKKTFLGTAAAVACLGFATVGISSGAQAAGGKINLSLGGYYNGLIAFTGTDSDERSYKFGSDAEVHVGGEMTLDNGLVVGFKTELELEDNSGDDVDEASIYFKGGFGKVVFGHQDGIGDTFAVNSTHALKRTMNNDTKNYALGLVNITTVNETSDDYMKITYMTPAFSGLKLGLSFTPEREKNARGYTAADEDNGDEIVEFGGVYMRKMNTVDFSMAATYVTANDDGLAHDLKEYNFGAKAKVQGFTFGGSYRNSEGFSLAKRNGIGMGDHEYTAVEGGASYETGPWLVSLQYAQHEAEDGTGATIIEGSQTFVQARYKVVKGLQIGAGVQFADDEMADLDGTALVIETHITF
jgi:outer membrane protein OmpU